MSDPNQPMSSNDLIQRAYGLHLGWKEAAEWLRGISGTCFQQGDDDQAWAIRDMAKRADDEARDRLIRFREMRDYRPSATEGGAQ